MTMQAFAQIRKVDEEKRLVFGRLAHESVDKSDEVMDYASSKPYFQKWSSDIAKDTGGQSLGNLRAMHGKVAAGKFVQVDFNDAEKAIDVVAKVVDDNEWKKVVEGVYTGFSIGGSYVGASKVEKVDGREVKRYTANPTEGSLVDRPCIPTAKFFEVRKADGSTLQKAFAAEAAPEAVDVPEVSGTPEQLAQLGKLMNEHGLSLGDLVEKALPGFLKDKKKAGDKGQHEAGETSEEEDAEEAKKKADPEYAEKLAKAQVALLRKGVYDCEPFGRVLAGLVNLQKSAQFEAFREGDNSPLPAKLQAAVAIVAECFKMMIDETVAENRAGTEAPELALAEQLGGLCKAVGGDPVLALLKAGARNSAADLARIKAVHALTVELGAECSPAQQAADAAADTAARSPVQQAANTAAKAEAPADLEKLIGARLDSELAKAVAPLQERIRQLEAMPARTSLVLRAVSKGEDVSDAPGAPLAKVAPIVDALGEAHEAASLIKSTHRAGGRPLGMPYAQPTN